MITPALKIWRDAVLTAQSAAQLSMCLSMLYDCVAWEKSIMKVVSVKRDVMFSMVTRQSPNAPSRSRFYGIKLTCTGLFLIVVLPYKTLLFGCLVYLLLSYLVTYSNSDVLYETCGSKVVKQNSKPVELSISARQILHFSP